MYPSSVELGVASVRLLSLDICGVVLDLHRLTQNVSVIYHSIESCAWSPRVSRECQALSVKQRAFSGLSRSASGDF